MSKQARAEILFLDPLNNKYYRMPLKTREEIDNFWSWYRNLKSQRQQQPPRR